MVFHLATKLDSFKAGHLTLDQLFSAIEKDRQAFRKDDVLQVLARREPELAKAFRYWIGN